MLSGGFFEEDPFFAGQRQQMQQMNQMNQMNQMFRDPFGFPPGGMLSIGAPPNAVAQQRTNIRQQQLQQQQQLQLQQQQQQQQLAPMDLFAFGGFGNMFQNMRRMMDDMHSTFDSAASNPQGQVFSQSSFMSYSNVGGTQPNVYHASSSTTQGPGGVRETRKMVRDSESGVEKMSVGRHLGTRGHVVERQRNRRTGDREENQEYINMDEEEASEFNRDWQEQSRQGQGPERLDYRRQDRANRRYRALPAPSQRHTHTHSHNRSPSYRDRE
ncbi:hypothetical protein ACOMHN_010559 [Nucella lapillus]